MISLKNTRAVAVLAVSIVSLSLGSVISHANWPSEKEALVVAEELKVMVSVGTGIINELQPMINSGNPEEAVVGKKHLLKLFLNDYQETTGSALNVDTEGLLGESRREFLKSYESVLENHQKILLIGGEDSFVPAYFRSEVLAEFNERLQGKVKGYATNRELDLLNPDWSIDALMDYSLFAYYIQDLLEKQDKKPLLQTVAGRVVGYYPMTLKPGCVACHARQGLVQEVGSFGGALVTEVLLAD